MKYNLFPLWCRSVRFALPILLASAAFAANTQDEQVVRKAYAKLAYAVQAHTVFDAAHKTPNLTLPELAKELQANELRFEIADMTSGPLSEIADKTFSDFVAVPDGREILQIVDTKQNLDDYINGIHATSNMATASWTDIQAIPSGASALFRC